VRRLTSAVRPTVGTGRISALTVFVILALAAPACTSGGEDVVRVYSGRHYDLEAAFLQFSEETGISVEFLTGTDSELRERIEAEGDETQADVYLTVDAGNLAVAADAGLFQPLDSPTLTEAIPDNLRDPGNRWFGLTVRARTIFYNPSLLPPGDVPLTYEELSEPSWAGRLCLRNSSNVYTQSLVASLIVHHGEDEARRIVQGWADNAQIMANDVLILEAIDAGQCEVGIANHYYLARLLDEGRDLDVELAWANQDGFGTHINISGGGVTRHADDPDLAQRLLEWLATDGQSPFVDGNHEYPANTSVSPEPLIAERFGTDFVRDPLNAAEFGALNPAAVRLMDEVGYE